MDILSAVFSIARNISDTDINEINKLHEKAKNEVSLYHDEQTGFKGLYARIHKGWILQTILIFIVPFLTTFLISKKQEILNKGLLQNNQNLDFDDDFDEEDDEENETREYERLRKKFGI